MLEGFHPAVARWFDARFAAPTAPQRRGWAEIKGGRDTLIAAPTGSGKTLAAFLACVDQLVRDGLDGRLEDRTDVLYVSPLKALGNDIQKNLEIPLGEILALAGGRGLLMPEIRTAVRTGDTLQPERRAMLKRPPHILVTTPESLYILLTADKSRAILRDVEGTYGDSGTNLSFSVSFDTRTPVPAKEHVALSLFVTIMSADMISLGQGPSGPPMWPDSETVANMNEWEVSVTFLDGLRLSRNLDARDRRRPPAVK